MARNLKLTPQNEEEGTTKRLACDGSWVKRWEKSQGLGGVDMASGKTCAPRALKVGWDFTIHCCLFLSRPIFPSREDENALRSRFLAGTTFGAWWPCFLSCKLFFFPRRSSISSFSRELPVDSQNNWSLLVSFLPLYLCPIVTIAEKEK